MSEYDACLLCFCIIRYCALHYRWHGFRNGRCISGGLLRSSEFFTNWLIGACPWFSQTGRCQYALCSITNVPRL